MALDPEIPLGIKPVGGVNLMDSMQTAGGLINLMANRQKLQANQIFSDAYKQSTDPQTGQTDYGKLQALVSQSPAAAFLPEFMGKIAQQRQQQVQYDTSQLELALKQQTDLRNRIGSLRAMPGFGAEDMTPHIKDAIISGVQNGSIPTQTAIQELGSIPTDPKKQADWINQHFLNSLSGEAKIRAVLPQSQIVDTKGHQLIGTIDPMTGKYTVNSVVQNELTPGEASANVEVIDPVTGAKYAITKQQQLNMMNGQQPGQTAPAQPGGYSGRMQPAGAPSGLPSGALPTGLAPAQQASMTTAATNQAEGSSKAAQELANSTDDAPMRINLLSQARDALGSITTGPGTEWRNNAKSLIAATPVLGDIARAAGLNPDNIKNYDEFKKIMIQYGNRVSSGLGGGTDARLNAALTGNANAGISTMANADILTKTIAAEKMRQAQAYAFQNSGLTSDKFNQWRTQWNKEVNPDAFVYASMTPEQRNAFVQRKTKDGTLQQFKRDLFKAQPYLGGQ